MVKCFEFVSCQVLFTNHLILPPTKCPFLAISVLHVLDNHPIHHLLDNHQIHFVPNRHHFPSSLQERFCQKCYPVKMQWTAYCRNKRKASKRIIRSTLIPITASNLQYSQVSVHCVLHQILNNDEEIHVDNWVECDIKPHQTYASIQQKNPRKQRRVYPMTPIIIIDTNPY